MELKESKGAGMNQNEQMRIESPVPLTEAEMKVFKLGWLECLAAQQALAAEPAPNHIPDATKMVGPAPLVRLTDEELTKHWCSTTDFDSLDLPLSLEDFKIVYESIIRAMIAKNGGKV